MLLDKDELDEADLLRLNTVDKDMHDKAIQVAGYILNLKAQAQSISEAINRMEDRESRLEGKIYKLTNYLKTELEHCNLTKIDDHPEFEISIRNNAERVWVEHEELIPEKFLLKKERVEISKTLIKEAIKDGQIVPGASLIRETSLHIK